MPKDNTAATKRDTYLPNIRVSRAELSAMKAKADDAGIFFSEYARRALISGVVVVPNKRADAELIRALSAIGNNLNQIARSVHISGGIDPTTNERLADVLPAISELIEGLMDGS